MVLAARFRLLGAGLSLLPGLAAAMLLLSDPSAAAPGATAAADPAPVASLETLVSGPQRSAANRARDPARHPVEDLRFFGIEPQDTVVEILPGGSGYWTEILGPYLRDAGRYIAANPPKADPSDEAVAGNAAFAAKVAADPADLGRVEVTEFAPPRDLVPPGSADVVLTFRNVHNWMSDGTAEAVFASFFRALKPGGTLGIEEHRGRADLPQDPAAKSGYVRQDVVIGLAERAGFRLVAASEANANPKDTKDYPDGVWTLPPTFRLKDKDRDRYAAIGESDRMLLRFVKP
jgi:predicted methyltransferase